MIYEINLLAHDEEFSPPERLLNVSRVDDVVFLAVCEYDETNGTRTHKTLSEIGVSVYHLHEALMTLENAYQREAFSDVHRSS